MFSSDNLWAGLTCQDWFADHCPSQGCDQLRNLKKVPPEGAVQNFSDDDCDPWSQLLCQDWFEGYCPITNHGFNRFNCKDNQNRGQVVPHNNVQFTSLPRKFVDIAVLNCIKVRFGDGFRVLNVTTGFESPWIFLGDLPSYVSQNDVEQVLRVFGELEKILMHSTQNSASTSVKACYTEPGSALQAAASLHGSIVFGVKITARVAVNNTSQGTGKIDDTTVRVQWPAPTVVSYAGYTTKEEAFAAISAANGSILRNYCVTAFLHKGLPTIGVFNACFINLPPDSSKEDIEAYGKTDGVMFERPNYPGFHGHTGRVEQLLRDVGDLVSFEMQSPPYLHGTYRAWARFSSPQVAKLASDLLNGRHFTFIGKGRLDVYHILTMEYLLSQETYQKIESEVQYLCMSAWKYGRYSSVYVKLNRFSKFHRISLSARTRAELATVKALFERILRGEVIQEDGKIAWDNYFGQPAGFAFIQTLQKKYPSVTINNVPSRRSINLIGSYKLRELVRSNILQKIKQLRAVKTHSVAIPNVIVGLFISANLKALKREIGAEALDVEVMKNVLRVRGDDAVLQKAQSAIQKAQKRHMAKRLADAIVCPVCFDEIISPVSVECGHAYCRTCLVGLFQSAIDNKSFPLKCIANEAKCTHLLTLSSAQDLLSSDDFHAIARASFFTYVHARPDEFHNCPTPNCPQIYRKTTKNPEAVLQCPDCLIRICPGCDAESHDGMSCLVRSTMDEKLFKEWSERHDVKNCPGCRVPIQRTEGCNHVTCTRCTTHICWVCMQTFPHGDGIYDHMHAVHGGIGL